MTIEVTADDIRRGRRGNAQHCAVALAVKRATGAQEVHIGGVGIMIAGRISPIPPTVRKFVRRFDGWPHVFVRPFAFDLP